MDKTIDKTIDKITENKIKNIIKKGFECGYSKTHKIIDIMYAVFPQVDLFFDEKEQEQAEKIYNFYEQKYINGEF